MGSISELYSQKKYNELIRNYLPRVSSMRVSSKVERNEKNTEILYYLLDSCYEKGYYFNLLHILKKLNEIKPVNLVNWNVEQIVFFSNAALESLLYCLMNNDSEKLGITYPIIPKVDDVISFQEELIRDHGVTLGDIPQNLRMVYADYKEGKLPIYTVDFLYPFDPIIPDYVFDLHECYPYISMEVRRVPRDADSLTSFTLKAYGFINTKFDWEGPRWETRHKFPAVKKALPIANLMLLHAVKASPGKMVLPYNIEQVSTVSMNQYRFDGMHTVFNGLLTGTDFTAQWIGNNCRWHSFTHEEMQELNRRVVATYENKAFVTTFHHATNLLSGGFYTESFLLFCFCCEGLVYHWCGEITKSFGIYDSYIKFAMPKNGKRFPSLFANLKYLKDRECISKSEFEGLEDYIHKIRNDTLRNKIVHGMKFHASKKDAEQSLNLLLDMQDMFQTIANKCKKEKS